MIRWWLPEPARNRDRDSPGWVSLVSLACGTDKLNGTHNLRPSITFSCSGPLQCAQDRAGVTAGAEFRWNGSKIWWDYTLANFVFVMLGIWESVKWISWWARLFYFLIVYGSHATVCTNVWFEGNGTEVKRNLLPLRWQMSKIVGFRNSK